MVVSTFLNWTWPNWPIESRALFWSTGKTWARRTASSSRGKSNSAVWVDYIVYLLVSLTKMPCSVGTLLPQGLSVPMKWLVQPESKMARRLTDGLRAGTKVLHENKFFKTKEYLVLTVPGLCQGARLQLL